MSFCPALIKRMPSVRDSPSLRCAVAAAAECASPEVHLKFLSMMKITIEPSWASNMPVELEAFMPMAHK